jgi:hypothetical protein
MKTILRQEIQLRFLLEFIKQILKARLFITQNKNSKILTLQLVHEIHYRREHIVTYLLFQTQF